MTSLQEAVHHDNIDTAIELVHLGAQLYADDAHVRACMRARTHAAGPRASATGGRCAVRVVRVGNARNPPPGRRSAATHSRCGAARGAGGAVVLGARSRSRSSAQAEARRAEIIHSAAVRAGPLRPLPLVCAARPDATAFARSAARSTCPWWACRKSSPPTSARSMRSVVSAAARQRRRRSCDPPCARRRFIAAHVLLARRWPCYSSRTARSLRSLRAETNVWRHSPCCCSRL
jgi:hypothetical protein